MFGGVGYLSFMINRCNEFNYCETVHDYSARYLNYTLANTTNGLTIRYTFMALRDSRPFQEYTCDQEQITDMSRINRYIMKYIATERYTIYVKTNDICTMKKPFSTVYLLGVGIGVILLIMCCCVICCTMFMDEDIKQYKFQVQYPPSPNDPPVIPIPLEQIHTLPTPPPVNTVCHICMDKQIGMIFIGCGHALCAECAMKLTVCPMCRQQSPKIPLYT
jgi:hypothetical protein